LEPSPGKNNTGWLRPTDGEALAISMKVLARRKERVEAT
jgi:hypothetical protein